MDLSNRKIAQPFAPNVFDLNISPISRDELIFLLISLNNFKYKAYDKQPTCEVIGLSCQIIVDEKNRLITFHGVKALLRILSHALRTFIKRERPTFFALTAVDNAGDEGGNSSEVSYTIPVPDTLTLTIAITTPTANEAFSTASSALSFGGAADNDRALQAVTWSTSDGQSGTATGTNSWSITSLACQKAIPPLPSWPWMLPVTRPLTYLR